MRPTSCSRDRLWNTTVTAAGCCFSVGVAFSESGYYLFSFFLSFAAVILLPAADTSGDTFIYVVGLDSRRGRIIGPGSFARSFFSTFSPTLSPSPFSIFSILLVLEKLDFSSNSYVVRKFCSSCIIMDVITRFSRFTHALFTIVRVAWGIRRGYARIRDLVRDFIVGYDFNSRAHK